MAACRRAGSAVSAPPPCCFEGPDARAGLSVSAADYGRTCQDVADCLGVYEGPLGCCGTPCPNTAIRADALDQYTRDVGRRTPNWCTPQPTCEPPAPCTEAAAP